MRKKTILIFLLLLAPLVAQPVFATSLWFQPSSQLYTYGSSLTVELRADIDPPDEVFGFSFDLSFDNGATFVPGPGAPGSYLTYDGFAVNSLLFDAPPPPFFDDGDGISGEVDFLSPNVWGMDLLLGTFSFSAPAAGMLGVETIYLGPGANGFVPDAIAPLSINGFIDEEGLLPAAIGAFGFMPNNPIATFTPRQAPPPIPEPGTLLLLGTGIAGLCGYGRKRKK